LGEEIATRGFVDPVLLALPRGGVAVAHAVAQVLRIAFEVLLVRKIGSPRDPEFGIGAIAEDLVPFFPPRALAMYDVEGDDVRQVVEAERLELQRRLNLYRPGQGLPPLRDRTVLIIDDGLATGVTAVAAARFLRRQSPRRLVLAVPVAPREIARFVAEAFDEIVCPYRPANFSGVAQWYEEFDQVDDDEVLSLLGRAHRQGQVREDGV